MTTEMPVPGCALALPLATLSAWRDGALPVAEAARVSTHIPTCAACQARLADYEELARGLLAIHVPEPTGGYGRNPRTRALTRAGHRGRGPKLAGGLGALVAVALIALAFAQVFHAFGPRTGTAATNTPVRASSKTPIPTTQTAALPTCQASQLAVSFLYDVVVDGHMGYRLGVSNTGGQGCVMEGYPTILLDGADGALTVQQQQATRAPTYLTAVKHVMLPPNRSETDFFDLDWALAPGPGITCITAQAITFTPPGTATNTTLGLHLQVCGVLSVSPIFEIVDNGPLGSTSPSDTTGLPTCQTSQLLLTDIQSGVALGHAADLFSLTNSSTSPCALNGYPTIRFLDAQGHTLEIPENKTTTAYTFQAQPPQALRLDPGRAVYFSTETDAPAPGTSCVSNVASIAVTVPGSTASLTVPYSANLLCGAISVSPLQAQPLGG